MRRLGLMVYVGNRVLAVWPGLTGVHWREAYVPAIGVQIVLHRSEPD